MIEAIHEGLQPFQHSSYPPSRNEKSESGGGGGGGETRMRCTLDTTIHGLVFEIVALKERWPHIGGPLYTQLIMA